MSQVALLTRAGCGDAIGARLSHSGLHTDSGSWYCRCDDRRPGVGHGCVLRSAARVEAILSDAARNQSRLHAPLSESLALTLGLDSAASLKDYFEAFNIGVPADTHPGLDLPRDIYTRNPWPACYADFDGQRFQSAVEAYFTEAGRNISPSSSPALAQASRTRLQVRKQSALASPRVDWRCCIRVQSVMRSRHLCAFLRAHRCTATKRKNPSKQEVCRSARFR